MPFIKVVTVVKVCLLQMAGSTGYENRTDTLVKIISILLIVCVFLST